MAVIIGNRLATLNHPAPHPAPHCCGIALTTPKFAGKLALIFSMGWLGKPGWSCAPGVAGAAPGCGSPRAGGLGQSCLLQPCSSLGCWREKQSEGNKNPLLA